MARWRRNKLLIPEFHLETVLEKDKTIATLSQNLHTVVTALQTAHKAGITSSQPPPSEALIPALKRRCGKGISPPTLQTEMELDGNNDLYAKIRVRNYQVAYSATDIVI